MIDALLFTTLPVTCHTRHVGPGSTFVAINGTKQDGVCFIPQALAAGATTIVVEQTAQLSPETLAAIEHADAKLVRVAHTRQALAQLSAQAHGYPAEKLSIIGITGTKGKTSTTFITEHLLRSAGYKTALLSTVKNRIGTVEYPTQLTTQQPDYIHAFLKKCVDQGVTHVVLEVAAQALSCHRVDTINFDAALFLNFGQEHGEFYPDPNDYFAAKAQIVKQIKPSGTFIVSGDDKRITELATQLLGTTIRTTQCEEPRRGIFDVETESVRGKPRGIQLATFNTHEPWSGSLAGIQFMHQGASYSCPALLGEFNVRNCRAALTCAQTFGISTETLQQALATFTGVPGRLDKYRLRTGATAFIDYAHNPLSFEQVLSTMRPYSKHMIVLFGAGGDRDATKRPVMGKIASTYADLVILTSDNPRSEDVITITDAIKGGIETAHSHKVHVMYDRAQAINYACSIATADSTIMLLGKGPDEYQEIKGVKTHFSERELLQSYLM